MFYTMGQSAMFYTMGSGSAVPVRRSVGRSVGRSLHGTPTLIPTKGKEGIFRAVVKRYIFLSGVT